MTQKNTPSIAMFHPDIPQNVGAMMRVCACLGVHLHIIEPCGFPWKEKEFRRTGMDYVHHVDLTRYVSWDDFIAQNRDSRLILTTTKAEKHHIDFAFQKGDILIAGQESSGAPDYVHKAADERVKIAMKSGTRSLNIVNATSILIGEALRQTGHFDTI